LFDKRLILNQSLQKIFDKQFTPHPSCLSHQFLQKVKVERLRVPNARVPLPSDEITTVADAFQTFVA